MSSKHSWQALAVIPVVVPLLAAAACSTSSPTTNDNFQRAVVPIQAPLTTLNPTKDVAAGTQVLSSMFEGLTYTNHDSGKVKPALADSWDTKDNRTWNFHLAPNAKWHDGSPVTAADVVFTYGLLKAPDNPNSATLRNMESISAVDDHTVATVLKDPNGAWPVTVGQLMIVPKAVYEKVGPDQFAKAPVGSGRYVFDSLISGGGVKVKAWADYRHGKPPIGELDFTPVTSAQAQVAGLQSGALDIVANIPFSQISQIKNANGLDVVSAESTNSIFLGYNIANSALADVNVRNAIDIAIDRNAIVQQIFKGNASALGNMVPSGTFGYDASIQPSKFDQAAAKDLLAKSGYKGETISLMYPSTQMAMADELGRAIGGYLSDIGLKVELKPLDYAAFLQQWTGKTIPGIYLFQYRNGVDAEFVITSLFAAKSRALFEDPQVADLVAAERGAVGEQERQKALNDLWKVGLTDKRYYSPIVAPNVVYGMKKGLPFPFNRSGLLTFVYVPN